MKHVGLYGWSPIPSSWRLTGDPIFLRFAKFCETRIFSEYYLTIIPRARMGSESIAHETEGRMVY